MLTEALLELLELELLEELPPVEVVGVAVGVEVGALQQVPVLGLAIQASLNSGFEQYLVVPEPTHSRPELHSISLVQVAAHCPGTGVAVGVMVTVGLTLGVMEGVTEGVTLIDGVTVGVPGGVVGVGSLGGSVGSLGGFVGLVSWQQPLLLAQHPNPAAQQVVPKPYAFVQYSLPSSAHCLSTSGSQTVPVQSFPPVQWHRSGWPPQAFESLTSHSYPGPVW